MAEHGNALFLILIAVALFAALSYAVTQSGRSGASIDREEQSLAAADIVQYGQMMKNAVNRMRLIHGCADDQISFEGHKGLSHNMSDTPYDYTNPNAPGSEDCHLFSNNGGGIIPKYLPEAATIDPDLVELNISHPRSFVFPTYRVEGLGQESGSEGTELVARMGRLEKEACIEINRNLGIGVAGADPPIDQVTGACHSPFTGTYPECTNALGDAAAALADQEAFCFGQSASGTIYYMFLQVLIVR